MTALSLMQHKLINNYHDNKTSAVIQTDFSAAFDTIDHDILIKKLEHYGLRGKISRIIQSFLANRYQYVSIDRVNSEVKEVLPCSVIQGSKLYSLLYTLYINKVTVVQNQINDDLYYKLTGEVNNDKTNGIHHEILQYVNDLNNIISTNSI